MIRFNDFNPSRSICMIYADLSIPILTYFMLFYAIMAYVMKYHFHHFMKFYDICHMVQYVIKYVNTGIKRSLWIRQIDLKGLKSLNRTKIQQNCKTKLSFCYFSIVFLSDSLLEIQGLCGDFKSTPIYLTFCMVSILTQYNENTLLLKWN